MKSSAKTTARRPKFDLTPISVDEALSNPALASIESTLRSLAGLAESPSGSVKSAVIVPPEKTKTQPELDPATEDIYNIPTGKSHIGDTHICQAHVGDIPVGIEPAILLQPAMVGSEVLIAGREAGNAPAEIRDAARYGDEVAEPDTVKSQTYESPIGDIPIGYKPVGTKVLSFEESIGNTESDKINNIQPIGVTPIGDKPTLDSPIDDSAIGELMSAELPGLPERISTLTSSVYASASLYADRPRYRQKVRPATDVQDGHSNGEQLLYQALWRVGRAETAETKLVTLGYGGMHDIAKLDRSNCKKNILSLIEKLAVETVGQHSVQRNVGKTYRVYSYSAILRRRKQAGMVYIVRANGVRFVTPDGTLLTGARAPRTQNLDTDIHICESHIGIYLDSGGETPIGHTFDPPTLPEGRPHTGPIGGPPRVDKEYSNPPGKDLQPASSSLQASVPPELIEGLHRIVSFIDHQAVSFLWAECCARAADCTVAEVMHFTKSKASVLASGKIQNPTGFLLAAVPKCFEGQSFSSFRRAQADREQAEAKLRQQQDRAQREIEEEAKREMEIYTRAEEKLNSMPDDERALLKQSVTREYLRRYPAASQMPDFDAWIRRMMIRELIKKLQSFH